MIIQGENSTPGRNVNIVKLMDFNGYNMTTLAEAAGIDKKTLINVVYGKNYPRLDTLLLLCRALNCTLDTLYPIDYTNIQ